MIEQMAAVAPGSPLAEAVGTRAGLLRASQANHDAVLAPDEPGGLSPELRHFLAARMARLGGDERLAGAYGAGAGAAPPTDATLAAILRHVDLVTVHPRDASPADIAALQEAGLATADIVRLSQLIAFVSYQLRVIAGLRLIGAAA